MVDPAPPGGADHVALTARLTVGLAVTVSTDKRRTVTHDPEAEQEDDARRTPAGRLDEGRRRDDERAPRRRRPDRDDDERSFHADP